MGFLLHQHFQNWKFRKSNIFNFSWLSNSILSMCNVSIHPISVWSYSFTRVKGPSLPNFQNSCIAWEFTTRSFVSFFKSIDISRFYHSVLSNSTHAIFFIRSSLNNFYTAFGRSKNLVCCKYRIFNWPLFIRNSSFRTVLLFKTFIILD